MARWTIFNDNSAQGNTMFTTAPGGHSISPNTGAPQAAGYGEDQCLCKEVCTSDFYITIADVHSIFHSNWTRTISFKGKKKTKKVCYKGDPDLDLPDQRPGLCFGSPSIDFSRGVFTSSRLTIKANHEVVKYEGSVMDCSACHERMQEGCGAEEEVVIEECNTETLRVTISSLRSMNCIEWGCGSDNMSPESEKRCDFGHNEFGRFQELADMLSDAGRSMSEEEADRFADHVRNPNSSVSKLLCRTLLTLRCCCPETEDPVVDCPGSFEPCCNCEPPLQETE